MQNQDIRVNRAFLETLSSLTPEQLDNLSSDYALRQRIDMDCRDLIRRAFDKNDHAALFQIHDVLSLIYEQDFSSARIERTEHETQPLFRDIAARFERAILDSEQEAIPPSLVSSYPEDPQEYVHWLRRLVSEHPAASHPFYNTFLRHHATAGDMRIYLAQETNLDPRFDDILALMQVGTSGAEKMEIAGNYWDEMGNGKPEDVHTALFAKSLAALGIDDRFLRSHLLLEAKISGNLSSALVLSRRHYFKAVGYFGVTEYLVPRRFKAFTEGWRRLCLPDEAILYHDLHIRIDGLHGAAWLKNVIMPLVQRDGRIGREIAMGALIRLGSSKRYLDSLLLSLGGVLPKAA